MQTKLTLTLDKEVIAEAKKHAQEQGKSLSEMVSNYFQYISSPSKPQPTANELSPRVKRLKGIMKVDEGFDYKKVLEAEKLKKHG